MWEKIVAIHGISKGFVSRIKSVRERRCSRKPRSRASVTLAHYSRLLCLSSHREMGITIYPPPKVVMRIKLIHIDTTLWVELCTLKGPAISSYYMSSAFSKLKAWCREFSTRSSSEWLSYLTCCAISLPITQKPWCECEVPCDPPLPW